MWNGVWVRTLPEHPTPTIVSYFVSKQRQAAPRLEYVLGLPHSQEATVLQCYARDASLPRQTSRLVHGFLSPGINATSALAPAPGRLPEDESCSNKRSNCNPPNNTSFPETVCPNSLDHLVTEGLGKANCNLKLVQYEKGEPQNVCSLHRPVRR